MPRGMTDIERKILDYMVAYLRSNTYQPSIREIGERFGIKSTKTVSEHLQALADKGFLERDPSRSRGVRILGVDLQPDAVTVPCFESLPTDRISGAADHLTIDRRLAGTKGSFLVRARGDELAGLGVLEGDWVLLEPVELHAVPDGGVVAVELEGEPARYGVVARNGRGLELRGLERGAAPVRLDDPGWIRLLGRVTGFVRRFDSAGRPPNLTTH